MKSAHFTPTIAWQEILESIRPELERVEERFRAELVSSVPEVTAIGEYLQVSGGKRLRPALLLLARKLFGEPGPSAITLGAVVEMIHTATLVHDDVIDGANLRRGRPSTNSRWGNHTSVLAGDWLYMQAFRAALQERNFHVLDILIELTQQMVEGELIQWGMIGRLDLTVEEHLGLVYRKTACLFGACTRLGAVLGEQDPQAEDALAEYGTNLGMAFQLVDGTLHPGGARHGGQGHRGAGVLHRPLERIAGASLALPDAPPREGAGQPLCPEGSGLSRRIPGLSRQAGVRNLAGFHREPGTLAPSSRFALRNLFLVPLGVQYRTPRK